MESGRQRWTQERRRKQPSLYDEWLNQEKTREHLAAAQNQTPSSVGRATIRAVSSESSSEEGAAATSILEGSLLVSSPPTSPKASSKRASLRNGSRDLLVRSESADGVAHSLRGVKDVTQSRTRIVEDRPPERSPPKPPFKTRHRVGSVNSTGLEPFHGSEEQSLLIGHAFKSSPEADSTMQTRISSRHRLLQSPPLRASAPPTTAPRTDRSVSPPPGINARRILELMKSTCGRMEGILAFKRGDSTSWSLSYCKINEELGSLVYEPKSDSGYGKTLVPDLRGCQVRRAFDRESKTPYLDVSLPNPSIEVHIRPHTQTEFERWFAALLCWQPIRPKGIQNRLVKPQATGIKTKPLVGTRRHSEISLLKEAPIIKVGKMIFWDPNVSYSDSRMRMTTRPRAHGMQSYVSRRRRRVSCTLRENGELKLYSESDDALVSVVQLSHLWRCAIQQLDPSVLDYEFCIAIYPQYTSYSTALSLSRPVFLSLESRVLYEVWVVLLRAFTIPQLYGPKQTVPKEGLGKAHDLPDLLTPRTTEMFRMERCLSIRIVEAKLLQPIIPKVESSLTNARRQDSNPKTPLEGYYVDVLLDGDTRAKTQIKNDGATPFWREEFNFEDLPAVLSNASIVVKRRPLDHTSDREKLESRQVQEAYGFFDTPGAYSGIHFDQTCGKVDIYPDELEACKEIEKWWPIINEHGQNVGEIFVRALAEEGVILMARDYQPLSDLLHRFSNGLTLRIAQMVPSELKRLSDCLLNIFQVSGQAKEWIMSLIEEEIDGVHKGTPVSRLRFSRRVGSNDSQESFGSASERELLVRDLNKNAMLEANLLFRGNTLLTKALDSHMKRLGKEYLEETLAEKLKEISDMDPDCEVDPNRITSAHDLEKKWRRLISCTSDLWTAIRDSVNRCPPELRIIFRHVRACAEDRYGDFLRSVSYSSVSGFLFLRFFCPAVLNPKLFGLLEDHPSPRARRTFTLIAKSLQGLANMTIFGSKEHWMEPMNQFLSSHRTEFKTFIDSICNLTPSDVAAVTTLPPSYSTPLAILQRLPPTSREGFPSLPYLIDQSRSFAALVTLWLDSVTKTSSNIPQSDGDIATFHAVCASLQERTHDFLERAERAERPNSGLSLKWEELVEQLEEGQLDTPSRKESLTGLDDREQSHLPALAPTTSAFSTTTITSASLSTPSGSPQPRAASEAGRGDDDATLGSASASIVIPVFDLNNNSNDGGTHSLEGSIHLSSGVSSETEFPTALPSVERERARQERKIRQQRREEKEKLGFRGMVPGFRKKKEKEREKERAKRPGSGSGSRV
ncbi:hypothetical protein B0A49_08979 [Cryomyces minteri]|uniref:Ras-GAP domain-containing protein n=1 Tax=Cryomyces minteri TaxID=331657 RepID=A0A4U0WRC9_9PEZI|nr:hypothetical protein B0A49_08979 [Cryomyces minteri]